MMYFALARQVFSGSGNINQEDQGCSSNITFPV